MPNALNDREKVSLMAELARLPWPALLSSRLMQIGMPEVSHMELILFIAEMLVLLTDPDERGCLAKGC